MRSRNKSEDTLRQIKIKTQQLKIYETQQKSPKKEIHSNAGLSQEARKISIINLTLYLKGLELSLIHI